MKLLYKVVSMIEEQKVEIMDAKEVKVRLAGQDEETLQIQKPYFRKHYKYQTILHLISGLHQRIFPS